MFFVVLVLGLTNLFLTASLYRIVKNGEHFHQIDYRSDVPFLQMIVTEPEPEQESEIPIPESVPTPVSEGPWRNQQNIDPWAPNSSAPTGGAPQERRPLERPPGFV